MLQNLGWISFGFAGVFLLLFLLALLQRLRKKSLKSRKKIKAMRRFYLVGVLVFAALGLVLSLLDLAEERKIGSFLADTSPVEAYQAAKGDATKAYSALPVELFSAGDDYYIRTGKNDIFGYIEKETTQTDEKGNQQKVLSYEKGLSFRETVQVSGEGNFLAIRTERGVLRLNGAYEYLTYEKDDTTFKNEVFSRNCSYVNANENGLYYVDRGDLYSAGYNSMGQLGDGTERNRIEGMKILENVASVSVSETHVLAVDRFGNLYGFGDNSYSEMGNRTTAQSITPVKLMSGVKQAQAGRYFSVVLTKNGDVFVAGRNQLGQLGTGDGREYANYFRILEGIDKISVHANSCAALTASGVLYVWGHNEHLQLGSGEAVIQTPTRVATDVYDVAMGHNSMGIIKQNRDVYVSGVARPVNNNEYFQALYQFNTTVPQEKLYRTKVAMPEPQA